MFKNKISKLAVIYSGLPHGSVLGSILFLLYINDIYHLEGSETILFARDTPVVIPCKNLETLNEKLTDSTLHTTQYFTSNFLKINASKT